MVNFRTGIPLLFTPLVPLLSYAQASDTLRTAAPADFYSFEIADSLVRVKKYERAVWTYINLYPRNPDSVVRCVHRLQPKIWDGDMPGFVQGTFARFAPMDPDISTFDFSGTTMDTVQLKKKAAWSEAIIRKLKAKAN